MGNEQIKNQMVRNVQKIREGHVLNDHEDVNRPFIECLALEMETDSFVRMFFEELEKHVQRIRRARGVEFERQARELDEVIEKFAQKKMEIVEKLKRSGVSMSENVLGHVYDLSDFMLGEQRYERKQFDYAAFFNKLELTREMLSDPNYTGFRDKYEKQKAKNETVRPRIAEIKRQLRRNKVFTRDSDKELEALKKELRDLEYELEEEEYLRRETSAFESLTPEQKELILQYLEADDAIRKGADEINSLIKKFRDSIPPKSDMEVMNEAMDRMVANGMNEDDLLKLFGRLDRIELRRRRGDYQSRKKVQTKSMEVASTFVQEVYEIDKVRGQKELKPKERE